MSNLLITTIQMKSVDNYDKLTALGFKFIGLLPDLGIKEYQVFIHHEYYRYEYYEAYKRDNVIVVAHPHDASDPFEIDIVGILSADNFYQGKFSTGINVLSKLYRERYTV